MTPLHPSPAAGRGSQLTAARYGSHSSHCLLLLPCHHQVGTGHSGRQLLAGLGVGQGQAGQSEIDLMRASGLIHRASGHLSGYERTPPPLLYLYLHLRYSHGAAAGYAPAAAAAVTAEPEPDHWGGPWCCLAWLIQPPHWQWQPGSLQVVPWLAASGGQGEMQHRRCLPARRGVIGGWVPYRRLPHLPLVCCPVETGQM
jgi:hypothetical protein